MLRSFIAFAEIILMCVTTWSYVEKVNIIS